MHQRSRCCLGRRRPPCSVTFHNTSWHIGPQRYTPLGYGSCFKVFSDLLQIRKLDPGPVLLLVFMFVTKIPNLCVLLLTNNLFVRVCGKMEPGDARVGDAVSSLSALLRHSDARVADAALRCFASLADRFARAHADPAPLAEHGM